MHELKTSKFSLVLRTHKILMFSTHSLKYSWYSSQKSKYPLYIDDTKHQKNRKDMYLFGVNFLEPFLKNANKCNFPLLYKWLHDFYTINTLINDIIYIMFI